MSEMEKIRHSLAHLLAMAVLEKFPKAKLGIGPTIENGFYYDFDFGADKRGLKTQISANNLSDIEKRMKELIKEDLEFERKEISLSEAKKIFKNQLYKLELIKELQKNKQPITIYKTFNNLRKSAFIDLCAGPHVKSTREINPDAFKLLKIAGAYWKGSEKNPMLTRIYGLAFETKKELDDYLKLQEEAEKRDHRKLGLELDLFSFSGLCGAGLPVWHPKGAIIRRLIEDFWKEEHQKREYQLVYSPHIGNLDIWKKSGHWEFYRENLYSPIKIDKEEYLLKPMNCPFHIFVYQHKIRSYKELPIRYAELGTVYRYERSGVLHGLTRVRCFTQDDAHIFCQPSQIKDEILKVLNLAEFMMKTFGFKNYKAYLSTRPEKSIGSDLSWKKATSSLEIALKEAKIKYDIEPAEGVFYGPKIDIKIEDALEREWQGPTIQVDFNFPERFGLYYIDQKGKKRQPVMIHRTVLGSMERFIGLLIEHYAGAFPLWLAPEQVWIMPVGSAHKRYAKEVAEILSKENIRIIVRDENETIAKKIRDGEVQKIPYLLVVGDKEMKNKSVAVRQAGNNEVSEMKLEDFKEKIKSEILEKR